MNKRFTFKYDSYDGQEFTIKLCYSEKRYNYQAYWQGENVTSDLAPHEFREIENEVETIISLGLGLELVKQSA